MDFLYHTHRSDTNFLSAVTQHHSLEVHWFTITDQASLLAQLSGIKILKEQLLYTFLGTPCLYTTSWR